MPKTLNETINLVRIIDEEAVKADSNNRARINFTKGTGENDKEKKYDRKNLKKFHSDKCNKVGHFEKQCKSEMKCNYCKKKGHFIKECRKWMKDQNQKSDNNKQNRWNRSNLAESSETPVNACIGMTAADLLSMLVNGKPTHFIFDIGSTSSIMWLKAFRERNIRI